jgi:hypothetical protein
MKKFLLIAVLLICPQLALAQNSQRNPCYSVNGVGCNPVGTNTPFPITGVNNVPTYSGSIAFANSGVGDLYCVYGSATKTVKVKGIRVSGVNGSTSTTSMAVIKRSTLGSGGGLTAITVTPSDSLNPASTASAIYFTSAPTPGTTVGNIRNRYITLPVATSGPVSEGLFQFSVYYDQPVVLRGIAEGVCVNAASAGASWAIDAEWTEE